jgi:hypothetical protein
MPGFINVRGEANTHILKGKGFGPKKEGPIGQKGGPGVMQRGAWAKNAPGDITKDYKADSTGSPGTYGHGKVSGHPGRMESVSGHGRTKAEGRRKSHMY